MIQAIAAVQIGTTQAMPISTSHGTSNRAGGASAGIGSSRSTEREAANTAAAIPTTDPTASGIPVSIVDAHHKPRRVNPVRRITASAIRRCSRRAATTSSCKARTTTANSMPSMASGA